VRVALGLLAFGCALGCGDEQSNPSGVGEPFRVQRAQYFDGTMPGTPPEMTSWEPGDPPRVIDMMVTGVQVQQGTGAKKLPGRASENSYSIGLSAPGVSAGWWMIGAGDLDTSVEPPRVTFTALADFSHTLRPGPLPVLLVGLDRQGNAGVQFREPLCVTSTGPEKDAACNGTPLPAASISLSWDTNVDLDLVVQTPDGRLVSPKNPALHDLDKGDTGELSPHIDRDSNANCVFDGVRTENLIWPTLTEEQGETERPSGLYQVYANLFDPCGQQTVRFHVKITTSEPAGGDGAGGGSGEDQVQHVLKDQAGQLIATQASPADPKGMFVTEVTFP